MKLNEFLEEFFAGCRDLSAETFAPPTSEQLRRADDNFRATFMAPALDELRSMLEVKTTVTPAGLINLAKAHINLYGLPMGTAPTFC